MLKFNPLLLSTARKRRMLNKKELAEKLGVTFHTVSRWEKGAVAPTEDNIKSLARLLNFPLSFFYGKDVDEPLTASFRSLTSMTAALRDAALSAGSIGFMISDWVEERFELPLIQVPDLHLFNPEGAARTLRQEWQLGEQPISNMLQLLESKGVRVFSLTENTKKVNAFSIWRRDRPYVFLNTMKSAESSRFDAAHELGHLVLHQDSHTTGREAEDQANKFASEFLMPAADVLAELPRVDSLTQIVTAKKRWKTSVAALNYKLHRIGITSDWKYRDFCIQLSQLGYNKSEPFSIERERSVVWQKVLRTLWSEKTTRKDIASDLNLPESELESLVFGTLDADFSDVKKSSRGLTLIS